MIMSRGSADSFGRNMRFFLRFRPETGGECQASWRLVICNDIPLSISRWMSGDVLLAWSTDRQPHAPRRRHRFSGCLIAEATSHAERYTSLTAFECCVMHAATVLLR